MGGKGLQGPPRRIDFAVHIHAEMGNGEQASEAAALEGAIDLVRPALRAMAREIVREEVSHGAGGPTTTHHEERGVVIARASGPQDERGVQQGAALVLLEDGRLARMDWTGTWGRVRGEDQRVSTTLRAYDSPAAAIADGWRAEEATAGLAAALERQASSIAPRRAAGADAMRLAEIVKRMR